MNYTMGKWFVDFRENVDPPLIVIRRQDEILCSFEDATTSLQKTLANANRICQCVNGWEELIKSISKFKRQIVEIRPYADCYKRVCECLGIENNILDFVRNLEQQRKSLLTVCKKFMKTWKRAGPSGSHQFEKFDTVVRMTKQVIEEMEENNNREE